MGLSLDNVRLVAPDNIMTRSVDQTLVLLDIDSGQSFTLDPIGARVWTLLTTTGSAAATHEALLTEFSADPERLRADVNAMIQQLTEQGLLVAESA